MTIYLGTQGWSYKDWVGGFYPAGTQARDYLAYYAEVFDAVELDTTFYGSPRPALVDMWKRSTPDGFQFTAKLPRSITHDRHLVDSSEELDEFLHAIAGLAPKLGAILIQLPPDFAVDEQPALDSFLSILPTDVRFAVEFRHRSWLRDETYELLRRRGVAWTVIDLYYMPRRIELTGDFTYIRWLGDRRKIQRMDAVQIDRRGELDEWAEKIEDVSRRVERVYGFANNHYSGHSPSDIRHLRKRLGMPETAPLSRQPDQPTLL